MRGIGNPLVREISARLPPQDAAWPKFIVMDHSAGGRMSEA
jgi:hypothetical protein